MSEGNSHFLMALGRVDGGMPVEVADEQLKKVISAVQQTGKKGKITVELEVSPNGELGFAVTAKVKATAPQVSFGQSFFFMGRDGALTRQSPDMQQLGLMTGSKTETNQ